jgi:hypothetical protein
MIDYHKDLVKALQTILPTHYELTITSKTATPCITYIERDNSAQETGDTLGYSRLSYTVKVWGNDIGLLQEYALEIDNVLRPLGFKRISSGELYDINSTMIQKIMAYEAYAQEVF